jgi:hypothetical protein
MPSERAAAAPFVFNFTAGPLVEIQFPTGLVGQIDRVAGSLSFEATATSSGARPATYDLSDLQWTMMVEWFTTTDPNRSIATLQSGENESGTLSLGNDVVWSGPPFDFLYDFIDIQAGGLHLHTESGFALTCFLMTEANDCAAGADTLDQLSFINFAGQVDLEGTYLIAHDSGTSIHVKQINSFARGQPVPEASILSLIGLGLGAHGLRRARKQ